MLAERKGMAVKLGETNGQGKDTTQRCRKKSKVEIDISSLKELPTQRLTATRERAAVGVRRSRPAIEPNMAGG